MRKRIILLILILVSLGTQNLTAQNISASQLSSINVDDLSDEQISGYWNKAKNQGYSIDQLEVIAKSKGMSTSQFSKLKQRISSLKFSNSNKVNEYDNERTSKDIDLSNLEKFGLEGQIPMAEDTNLLFGYNFFNNPNISFTPNLNVATPTTYQIGPGDELLIDIWGAAENNYRKTVSTEGAIRIENIGPVYVSGLSIDKAKSKIISYLKKIYNGIGASNSSYNKVHAEVSLVGVRTVQVNIIGEVKVPGTYSLSALSSVLNALYASGGPTENGTFRNIQLVRGGKLHQEFDIYKYLINGSEKGNVLLHDQDVIIIKPYENKIVVEGNVKRAGIYELKDSENISNLIEYFGGFKAEAYKERLLVERVNGKQKQVNEVRIKDQSEFVLKDGDKITVGKVVDRFENRVSIGGAIYRPGNYELTDGLTLSKLIENASGIKDVAFLDRGIIYRTYDDIRKEVLPFSIKEVLAKTIDINLKREDRVHIFDKYQLKEKYTVSIDGAVNNPQTFDFIDNMRVEDLIAMSGGFKDGADVGEIDISRRVADGSFKTISKDIKSTTTNDLIVDNTNQLILEPFDKVSVRYLKGYSVQKNVTIKGNVAYPGNYSITDKDERISDLVKKAGGFSPYAYLKGATLIRKKQETKKDNSQLKILESLEVQDSLLNVYEQIKEFKIGIDLKKIMKSSGQKSKFDLILEEGDVIVIPSEKQTVEIRGEILAPSMVRYDKSNSFKDYVNSSGGYSEKAKKSKGYVIYANGDIRSSKNFLFFKTYPKIEPGALIVIPQKAERSRMSLQEILGITTGLSTIGILINTLVK
jgi:protein involved in polysaccharide export with SLBB domain